MSITFKKINRSKINLILVILLGIDITLYSVVSFLMVGSVVIALGKSIWSSRKDMTFSFDSLRLGDCELELKRVEEDRLYFTLDGKIEVTQTEYFYNLENEKYEIFKIDGKNITCGEYTTFIQTGEKHVYIEGYSKIYVDSYDNYTCIDIKTSLSNITFTFSDTLKAKYNIEINSPNRRYRLVDKVSTGEYVSELDRNALTKFANVVGDISAVFIPIVCVLEVVLGVGTIVENVKAKKKKEETSI